MATNSSRTSKQHVLVNLLNCFTFVDTEKQLVTAAPIFLHLGYKISDSAQAILSQPMVLQYTNCTEFAPREALFISIAQIGELIVNAPEAKYISHVLEFVKNTLMPLFKPAAPQTSPETNKIELNPVKASEPLMMSSQEIANVVKRRHDNVKRTMEMLQNKELISITQIEEPTKGGGKPKTIYYVNKRDSYVVVAQLSPEFTADLVDRWQELENQLAGGVPQISAQPVATTPALPSAKDLARMVIQSEEEKEQLQRSYNFLGDELCQAIREKAQIGSKREASALGKLARANDKLKLRDEKICQLEAKLSSPVSEYEYATILAVQSRLKYIKVSGLKLTYFCNRNGLVIKDIPDDRYGAVHSYPAQAWRDVYQIDINAVLNKVA